MHIILVLCYDLTRTLLNVYGKVAQRLVKPFTSNLEIYVPSEF